MQPEEEIRKLLGRSWSSFNELYGGVRKVIGHEFHFDCFEEWNGVVIIRSSPIGENERRFNFEVELQKVNLAA